MKERPGTLLLKHRCGFLFVLITVSRLKEVKDLLPVANW